MKIITAIVLVLGISTPAWANPTIANSVTYECVLDLSCEKELKSRIKRYKKEVKSLKFANYTNGKKGYKFLSNSIKRIKKAAVKNKYSKIKNLLESIKSKVDGDSAIPDILIGADANHLLEKTNELLNFLAYVSKPQVLKFISDKETVELNQNLTFSWEVYNVRRNSCRIGAATVPGVYETFNKVDVGLSVSTYTTANIVETTSFALICSLKGLGEVQLAEKTFTIVDTTAPVITLIGNAIITVEAGTTFSDPGTTVSDNVDTDLTVIVTDTVDDTTPGTYTLTYNVSDSAGNTAIAVTRTVNVVDTTAPVITLTGGAVITVEAGTPFSDPDTTVIDNVDTGLTVIVTGSVDATTLGTYTLTYNVTDSAGNASATMTRTVNVVDTTAPVITLIGNAVITVDADSTFSDPGTTVSDNVDTGLAASVTGTVDTSTVGRYELNYNVSDAAGNIATTVKRTVNVVRLTAYVSIKDLEVPGNRFGFVIENENINDNPRNFTSLKGDLFGMSAAYLGDIDGDGFENFAIGAPGFDHNNGRIFVMNGGRHSTTQTAQSLSYSDYLGTYNYDGCFIGIQSCPEMLEYFTAQGVSAQKIPSRERLGTEIQRGGDINGDGYPDFIVASPYGSTSRPSLAGTIYVVFGGPTYDSEMSLTELETSGSGKGFAIFGAIPRTVENFRNNITSSFAGYRVLGNLDMNGDGLQDIVVSAPDESDNGVVYVVFGKADDQIVRLVHLKVAGSGKGFAINSNVKGLINRGNASLLDHVGDINHDGMDDLSVGIGTGFGYNDSTFILFGKTDDEPVNVNQIGDSDVNQTDQDDYIFVEGKLETVVLETYPEVKLTGCCYADSDVENSGGFDVNGDGYTDYVSSYQKIEDGVQANYYVFFGGENPAHGYSLQNIQNGEPHGFEITSPYNSLAPFFGLGSIDNVELIDDINGDGLADIIISHSRPYQAGDDKGKIWVIYGKTDFASIDLTDVEAGIGGFVIVNDIISKGFANGLATDGDIDGDGINDLLFGSFEHDGISINSGRAYVFYGGDHNLSINFYGSDIADNYSASSRDESIIGGRGDDNLISAGGEVAVYGGAGNDIITITDHQFRRIKGGQGIDKLVVDTGLELDLNLFTNRLASLEKIDLQSGSSIRTDRFGILNLSDTSNAVYFEGNGTVKLAGEGWVEDGEENGYTKYSNGLALVFVLPGVDVNTAPVIIPTEISMIEGLSADEFVATVIASDLQWDPILFSIVGGSGQSEFYIDETTGDLWVTGNATFDFETEPLGYTLEIQVSDDSGLTTSGVVQVTITNRNEPPALSFPDFISLSEGASQNDQVTVAVALDEDQGDVFTFEITDGNYDSNFAIDSLTGAITVAYDGALDFEEVEQHLITITVTDAGGLSASADLTVQVLDESSVTRNFAVSFNSGNRSLWSNDDTFKIPDLPFGTTFDFPAGDGLALPIGMGEIDFDISGNGEFGGSLSASGGFVNATIPVSIQISIPDEVVPGQIIEIPTSFQYDNPTIVAETVGFDLAAGLKINQGAVNMIWKQGDDEKTIFSADLGLIDAAKTHTINPVQFEGRWNNGSFMVNSGAELINIEYPWNSYLGMGLSGKGLPAETGSIGFQILDYPATIDYTWIWLTLKVFVSTSQISSVDVNAIKGTMTFSDNTTQEFIVGDTIQYEVPSDSNGKIDVALEFELDATFKYKTEFFLRLVKRWELLDVNLSIHQIPCLPTESCNVKTVTAGTNGPAYIFAPSLMLTHKIEPKEFKMEGFETKTFKTILDVQQ
ncbi:MAG: DUF5011 domain-containing protein [Alcanivoracaceae bacterium]|nr:DUF5011 domain-containing protein [Alcanivoracaceae bacterium]